MEISDVRRRLRRKIDEARQAAAERRARTGAAAAAYDTFLERIATPVFRMFAAALKAEGHPFQVFTPAGGLKLASEHRSRDFIELSLDADRDRPSVLARVSRGRGGRVISDERPLREGTDVEQLTEEDVLRFLLDVIPEFVMR